MRLLVDTDAFCKLAMGGLLHDALSLLGTDLLECGRLPALLPMLRRGRLRKVYGPDRCDDMILIANTIPVVVQPSDKWLDKLTQIEAIDPGETQLFAAAAEAGLIVVSGDKRALRALKDVAGFADALAGRIVVLEAIMLALCDRLGAEVVRQRVESLAAVDKVIQICFSDSGQDPRDGLWSYYKDLAEEVSPLVLWDPGQGGRA